MENASNEAPNQPKPQQAKTHIPKESRDELSTYDPSDLTQKLIKEAPKGTTRVVDPTRRKLIQIVALTKEEMEAALAAVLEDDKYEDYAVKLTFPAGNTWQLKLGKQAVGGNRLIPIEEFTRSIYTVISRVISVKKGRGKYGEQGEIGTEVA